MNKTDDTNLPDGSFDATPLAMQMQQAWEQVNSGDTSSATADLFRGALTLASADMDTASGEYAKVMIDVSTGLFLLGDQYFDEAIQLLADGIETKTVVDGELNIECGRLHRQLSAMYNARQDFQNAADSMSKTIDILEALDAFGMPVDPEEKSVAYKELAKLRLKADEARGEDEEVESASRRLIHCDDRYHE